MTYDPRRDISHTVTIAIQQLYRNNSHTTAVSIWTIVTLTIEKKIKGEYTIFITVYILLPIVLIVALNSST